MPLSAPIDPGANYRVTFTRVVKVGVLKLLPRHTNEVSGAKLQSIIDEYGEAVIDRADVI